MKKVVPTKASLLSMEYPKPLSSRGAENLTKNAKQKPWKAQMNITVRFPHYRICGVTAQEYSTSNLL